MSLQDIKRTLVAPKQQRNNESNRAVIYTRVSTSKQVDNTSLESQIKRSREYCLKNNFIVVNEFGGTYESAKTDHERKEFMAMINFVKDKRNRIKHIVVYSTDRFSRAGGSAISLEEELRSKYGILINYVNQDFDDSTPMGVYIRSIGYLNSQLENNIRREKVIGGMCAKLHQGYFPYSAPIGYSSTDIPGLKKPNEKAIFIRKAFELKDHGFSHDEIIAKLQLQGFKIGIKRLTDIFCNPFYCGYLRSSLISDGFLIGKHEPIVSEELFLRVNNAKAIYNKTDYTPEKNNPFPLKGFIICSRCNKKWTAYTVLKKGISYYKCNTTGCACNRSVKQLHQDFIELLKGYKIPEILEAPFKAQLRLLFEEKNQSRAKERDRLESRIKSINEDIRNVRTKYALEKIDEITFNDAIAQLSNEKADLDKAYDEANVQLSNLKEFVDFSVNLSRNLDQAWVSGVSGVNRRLQNVLFPGGIVYDNESRTYRTIKVNGIFSLFNSISNGYKRKEEGLACNPSTNSDLVVPTGIEPVSKV